MLNYTERQIVCLALDEMSMHHVENFVDDDGQPITEEWLEKLRDKLDRLQEETI